MNQSDTYQLAVAVIDVAYNYTFYRGDQCYTECVHCKASIFAKDCINMITHSPSCIVLLAKRYAA